MRNKNILALCISALGLLSSCNSFLDQTPLSTITPENYLNDESQLGAYSVARYSIFPTHGNWSFGTFGIDVATDNMTGTLVTFANVIIFLIQLNLKEKQEQSQEVQLILNTILVKYI